MNSTENGLQNRENFFPRNNPIRAVREDLDRIIGRRHAIMIDIANAMKVAGKPNVFPILKQSDNLVIVGQANMLPLRLDGIDRPGLRMFGDILGTLGQTMGAHGNNQRGNRNHNRGTGQR